jgi:hypothetical protein
MARPDVDDGCIDYRADHFAAVFGAVESLVVPVLTVYAVVKKPATKPPPPHCR